MAVYVRLLLGFIFQTLSPIFATDFNRSTKLTSKPMRFPPGLVKVAKDRKSALLGPLHNRQLNELFYRSIRTTVNQAAAHAEATGGPLIVTVTAADAGGGRRFPRFRYRIKGKGKGKLEDH
ncbi:hypothetical protein C8R43DRAFT_952493 [Mycena crocata]|nr:hypothetical protein C8R43DRAFT_952493 [Mycena crocata]